MRGDGLFVLVLVLAGCGPPDAPEELNALTHFLYRYWDTTAMEDGVAKLDQQMAGVNFGGDLDDRSFRVTPLGRDELAGVPWPMDRDPQNAIGSCVAHKSQWPMDDQARLITSPDQLEAEPAAKSYLRRFIDPTDPSCFVDRGCTLLLTDNEITRENSVLTLSYLLHKNLRWVRLGDRWAVAGRSYIDRAFPGQKDGTAMYQSYGQDILMGQPDGQTIRYQCSWSEQDLGFAVEDGLALAILVDAMDRALSATDTTIAARFHAM